MEYAWWNDVETKPGVGYPKRWEDQEEWKGGWQLDRKGRLRLKAGGKLRKLASLFYNPDLPSLDDYYEPWTYDYDKLTSAPPSKHQPVARPHSQVTGRRMDLELGPELGGRPRRRPRARPHGPEPARRRRGAGAPAVRAGVHVLPAAHLRALPEPLVRGVVPIGRHVQARGGRHRPHRPGQVPQLAVLRLRLPPTRRSTSTGTPARPRSAPSATRGSSRASRRSARRPAWGASATSGWCSTTPTASTRPPRRRTRRTSSRPSWASSSTPPIPTSAPRRARRQSPTTGSRPPPALACLALGATGSRRCSTSSTDDADGPGTSRRCRP